MRPLTTAGGLALEPELRVEWRHEFEQHSTDLDAKLSGGGAYFTTPSRDQARDSLLLGAALKAQLSQLISGAISYDCEVRSSGDAIDHALGLHLSVRF
ncbi:MAG: autotransporter outer membrane beta-barrel domain-containing protein [Desulfurivibrio sp.]|jgi:outer membrane autotransporter protein|nr:MAG: autotransporter outer membrane beta-barrel domain-containing protein [Desulfurivibrio sp.]